MKKEDRQVFWLDYFDSTISRSEGRRIPISMAVKSPKLDELLEAARSLGLEAEAFEARHPKRPRKVSGYISVERVGKKQELLRRIAKTLSQVRGRSR